jgi:hypothetical protein
MQKKLLSALLAVLIVVMTIASPANTVQAATSTSNAIKVIDTLGIMKTDKGDLSVGTTKVTRAQFAQMLINTSTYKGKVSAESNVSLFNDVSKKYWAAGYIQTAINQGWMSGYLNGKFMPNQSITLKEAVNGILKLLGYTNSDFTGNIISGQMALYNIKGLNKNITKTKNQQLTVDDCKNLFYNTLTATTKDGKIYAETLGYKLDSNGEIDYLTLVNSEMEGPILADNNWKSEIPFALADAIYYKNGSSSSYSDIEEYDILYYSESLKTIWAYDTKVTGTLQSVSPNRLSPTSITVAGKEYTLGTNDMTVEFSTLGSKDLGDIVTVLLGKDDTVVGVLDLDEYNTTITGIVLSTGTHLVEDAKGDYSSTNYVTYVDAKGNEYQQDYDKNKLYFNEGEIVRVTYQDGVSKYDIGNVSFGTNTFSADGNKLGAIKLATNVKILDLYDDQYVSVYPSRLANVTLGSSTVNYYAVNDVGEITELILNNVTGDLYDYGILTGIAYQQGDNVNVSYLLDGKSSTTSVSINANYNLEEGPKGFLFSGNKLISSIRLNEVNVTAISKTTVQDSSTKYKLAENVQAFYFNDGSYVSTTVDKISNLTKYKLTAYYDRTISSGGCVRVIVAENIN